MLTKGDLLAIKTIVKTEVAELRTELKVDMDKNTDDLIEFITTRFRTDETQFQNHERRITHLENVTFNKV